MTVPDRPEAHAQHGDDGSALIERLTAGDSAAFEILFARYFNRLRRYAYGFTRSWTEAEDLVHDMFLLLWRRKRPLDGVRDLNAYLYRITRNLALNHVRRRTVEARWQAGEAAAHAAALVENASRAPDAEQRLASDERVAALLCAVDSLPPRQRQVILLRWREGKTLDEIAATLGISVNTVEIHTTRAHKHLRKLLPGLLVL
jgi:RNA polymerase sigma-70 factor (ECF subfamily)